MREADERLDDEHNHHDGSHDCMGIIVQLSEFNVSIHFLLIHSIEPEEYEGTLTYSTNYLRHSSSNCESRENHHPS